MVLTDSLHRLILLSQTTKSMLEGLFRSNLPPGGWPGFQTTKSSQPQQGEHTHMTMRLLEMVSMLMFLILAFWWNMR